MLKPITSIGQEDGIVSWFALVVSGISLLVTYLNYQRDKPKLKLRHSFSAGLYELPRLSLEVVNVGTRPTTLSEVGYRIEHEYELRIGGASSRKTTSPVATQNITLSKDPILLDSGDSKTFVREFKTWPRGIGIHADYPLRPYVKSVHGEIWGQAKLTLRQIVNPGGMGMMPKNIPPSALEPLRFTPKPLPVYTWWKIWKPHHLRAGSFERQCKRYVLRVRKLLIGM